MKDGIELLNGVRNPVTVPSEELTKKLIRDLGLFGEDIENAKSLVAYHYFMVDVVRMYEPSDFVAVIEREWACASDWHAREQVQPSNLEGRVRAWLATLELHQLCAVYVFWGATDSLSIAFTAATEVMDDGSNCCKVIADRLGNCTESDVKELLSAYLTYFSEGGQPADQQ